MRLAAAYRNAGTAGNPAEKEAQVFSLPSHLSETQLVALGFQSLWKLEFFHVDPNKANVVQMHRTVSRPTSLLESRQQPLAELTSAMPRQDRCRDGQYRQVHLRAGQRGQSQHLRSECRGRRRRMDGALGCHGADPGDRLRTLGHGQQRRWHPVQ